MYVVLNFPTLDFLVHKEKEREFQKKFCGMSFYTLFLYIPRSCLFTHTLVSKKALGYVNKTVGIIMHNENIIFCLILLTGIWYVHMYV